MWLDAHDKAWPIGKYKDLHAEEVIMALSQSGRDAGSCVRERAGFVWNLTEDHLRTLAVARLERLLREGRRQIDGLFSEEGVIALPKISPGQVEGADEVGSLAGYLCDSFGVELDEVKGTPLGVLVEKLLDLDERGCAVLAETLEPAWHGAQRAGGFQEALGRIGALLR